MTKPKASAKPRKPRTVTVPKPKVTPVPSAPLETIDPATLHAEREAAMAASPAPVTTPPTDSVVQTNVSLPMSSEQTADMTMGSDPASSTPVVSVAVTVPPPATVDVSVANPKKKVSFEFELIDEIKHFYKITSLYFIVLLGCSGDLYNLAITSGLITAQTTPPILMKALHWIAFTTAVIRMMKLNVSKTEGSTTTTTTVNS
jgi:hypothetical protein